MLAELVYNFNPNYEDKRLTQQKMSRRR